ncbi:hypothetical protein QE389_002484 [Brevundimonas sp. SORGH_AS 993]|nr:hypothetical protein [Brevundimonas sp. SORGH_AS_0993]
MDCRPKGERRAFESARAALRQSPRLQLVQDIGDDLSVGEAGDVVRARAVAGRGGQVPFQRASPALRCSPTGVTAHADFGARPSSVRFAATFCQ